MLLFLLISRRLGEVLECAEDIEIDVPKIWGYIAEILCHPVVHHSLALGTLISTSFSPNLLFSGKAAVLTTKLLRQCVGVMLEEAVTKLWAGCREQHGCLQLRAEDLDVSGEGDGSEDLDVSGEGDGSEDLGVSGEGGSGSSEDLCVSGKGVKVIV